VNSQVIEAILGGFSAVLPEAILVGVACLLFLQGTFVQSRRLSAWSALAGLCGAAAAALLVQPTPLSPGAAFAGPIFLDALGIYVVWLALLAGALLVLISWDEVPDAVAAEYHGCLLVSIAGLALVGTANELVLLFLAVELVSIPSYILLYLPRNDLAAQEAAVKYFLLSIFSSALLLLGFSYLYGLTGTTNIPAIVHALHSAEVDVQASAGTLRFPYLAIAALVLVVAGMGFKMSIAPFHFYAPDVYQGASCAAAALLAVVPKAAGFVALVRLLGFAIPYADPRGIGFADQAPVLFWMLAAVTMTLGNVLALLQSNLRRLLAYSSVAHAGYMLIGLAVVHASARVTDRALLLPGGVEAILFYLAAYALMTLGAFAVLACLSTPERPVETEDDLAGLATTHPGLALLMAVFLFSLIGMPLTAGFVGKVLLFFGALAIEGSRAALFRWLALIGTLNAALGGWYYLRILAKIYFQTAVKPFPSARPLPAFCAVVVCALATLAFGMHPAPLVHAIRQTRPAPSTVAAASDAHPTSVAARP
jgi:NADH-quinone oxidoreductase subunit N